MLSELTENMGVTPVTVTRMADRLEKNGFLKKEKCPNDQRAVRITLTDRGREAAMYITEQTWNQLEQKMVSNLSTEERIILKRLLMQMLSNLSEDTE